MTLSRGVVTMCAAQACAQIGAFSVAAVLSTLISVWALTNTEAGWLGGIYYAAYTLAVPLLSSLTDRVDPKRIYLGSVAVTAVAFAGFAWIASGFWSALAFRALMGAGWAGSYMPGLKALSDLVEGPQQSRALDEPEHERLEPGPADVDGDSPQVRGRRRWLARCEEDRLPRPGVRPPRPHLRRRRTAGVGSAPDVRETRGHCSAQRLPDQTDA
jgi:hypothetical protein